MIQNVFDVVQVSVCNFRKLLVDSFLSVESVNVIDDVLDLPIVQFVDFQVIFIRTVSSNEVIPALDDSRNIA